MSWVDCLLGLWTCAASSWWGFAVWIVHRTRPTSSPALDDSPPEPLCIFKPLPFVATPLERSALSAAVESFVVQMEPGDDLLLGMPESAWPEWQDTVEAWRQRPASGRVHVIRGDPVQARANPKVAWLEVLAREARAEVWLWSDADVVAPAGLLAHLRRSLGDPRIKAVTCPYFVGRVGSAAGMLDAAFVNAEFLPGALLLGRRDRMAMTFGAATVFRAEDLRASTNWDELGAALADDYLLGQRFESVALGGKWVETLALETTWGGALRHYYRWQKTIRWCRPFAYAALIAILPLLGWGVRLAGGGGWMAGLGFGLQWAVEYTAVVLLCRTLRCDFPPGAWVGLALWPILRAAAWMAVWIPFPVLWRGARARWRRPFA